MSNDEVYRLISDVLALAGNYSVDTFRTALVHVERSFQGHDQRALLRIIQTLEALVEERTRKNEATHRHEVPRADYEFQEVTAILEDPAFLPRKADLLLVLNKIMGKAALKASPKDSRDTVVRKAISAFSTFSASTRSRVYKTLHARFIKARGSSLKDWSDIISE